MCLWVISVYLFLHELHISAPPKNPHIDIEYNIVLSTNNELELDSDLKLTIDKVMCVSILMFLIFLIWLTN